LFYERFAINPLISVIRKKRGIMRKLALALCFGFMSIMIVSGQGAYLPPERPRLVVGIVVEQLRFDQLEKLRDRLSDNGIKRLLNEGTFFRNASYDYMLTQSAPGYSTISTGTEPSYHGITSDNWYLPLKNELVYCTKDVSVNPAGGSYESGLHSPVNLQASTFTDELMLASGRKSKVFAVGMKDIQRSFQPAMQRMVPSGTITPPEPGCRRPIIWKGFPAG
jgi:predicted AlkP superfamily pyrophosphatase or phosphodiesterase